MARRVLSENETKLIEGISISQYYNDYIHPINPNKFRIMKGEKPSGLCPFHEDTDPSFHDWKAKKIFRCFGCGTAGDVIRFHQLTRSTYYKDYISKEQAMRQLAAYYGIELEVDEETGEIKQESYIEIAKRKLLETQKVLGDPRDISKMSISSFRYANNRVKNMNGISADRKASSYHTLDIMYAAHIAEQKEKGSDING